MIDGNILWFALSSMITTFPFILTPTTEKVVPRSIPTVVTLPLKPRAANTAQATKILLFC